MLPEGSGAVGASPNSAQNRTKPAHAVSHCSPPSTSTWVPWASTSSTMQPAAANDVTDMLLAWGAGDARASEAVAPLVYGELRRQAQLALRGEDDGHTLETTALVHEAWLRLDAQHDARWESRTQFFAVAAQIMRRILVDHHAGATPSNAAPRRRTSRSALSIARDTQRAYPRPRRRRSIPSIFSRSTTRSHASPRWIRKRLDSWSSVTSRA